VNEREKRKSVGTTQEKKGKTEDFRDTRHVIGGYIAKNDMQRARNIVLCGPIAEPPCLERKGITKRTKKKTRGKKFKNGVQAVFREHPDSKCLGKEKTQKGKGGGQGRGMNAALHRRKKKFLVKKKKKSDVHKPNRGND